MILTDLVRETAARRPEALALSAADGHMTYAELDATADQLAHALRDRGVRAGDRVGVWIEKSVRGVAAMQAVLRLGAAYVPLDPGSPTPRIQTILRDCRMSAVVTTAARARTGLVDDLAGLPRLTLDSSGGEWDAITALPRTPVDAARADEHALAYILYTSGSTGVPKGVCISHRNALAFVEWAAETLRPDEADRFSNHAPFHFDLSVLDLYVPFLTGGSVHCIPEAVAYAPAKLVEFARSEAITVWYSVPSALILMMDEGGLLDARDLAWRAVLFAGEPFPIKHLRRLRERWPAARLLNLYGPTETNVCTQHEVFEIEPERTHPVPIGRACSGDEVWAVTDSGERAGVGEAGELWVSGPTVMLGYWGKPPQGDAPYRTGDLVRLQEDGSYVYLGRRDHMVKVRGHRIELGEIEAALLSHPAVHEAAVAVKGQGLESRLVAFVVPAAEARPGIVSIKRHCAERLPRYMIVDELRVLSSLPRTGNGKIDRKRLATMLEEAESARAASDAR